VDDIFLSEPVAANWQRADIGSVVLAALTDQFVLRGSGADVSGTADAFHFVYQTRPCARHWRRSIEPTAHSTPLALLIGTVYKTVYKKW